MRLEWIGHACFKLTTDSGMRIFTDPYDESVGITMIPLKADVVTISHDHHDHCETSQLIGEPMILRAAQPLQMGGLSIRAVRSYHDNAQGALRGENYIRIFEAEGLKIVHMGDQGCMPSDDVLSEIAGADLLLIPVGGTYTIDADGAKAIIGRVSPRCVVPMHVKTAHCPYPIAKVDAFLSLMGCDGIQSESALVFTPQQCPQGVHLLRPMADSL